MYYHCRCTSIYQPLWSLKKICVTFLNNQSFSEEKGGYRYGGKSSSAGSGQNNISSDQRDGGDSLGEGGGGGGTDQGQAEGQSIDKAQKLKLKFGFLLDTELGMRSKI